MSDAIDEVRKKGNAIVILIIIIQTPSDDVEKTAKYIQNVLRAKMAETRSVADVAERLIAKELYPFPTYGDIFYAPQVEALHENDNTVNTSDRDIILVGMQ